MKEPVITKLVIAVLVALLVLPLAAWAQPKVSISIVAEKEAVVAENGKKVKKMVKARDIMPGEVITYTLNYHNAGNETATNVVISDPIPAGTSFIPGSASEEGDLAFSIDQGKSFNKPTLLTYEVKTASGEKEKKVASPEDYTNIQWIVASVPAGVKGSVSFRVKVK
jgi:uncharacterized repeat protein (TIGR01451 family)